MIAEVIGGYLANSLSIMTDAAHMFSDLCGFGISMASVFITKKEATRSMSFGYHRAEVIGASLSVLLIWGLTIWLLSEAVNRFINPEEVDGLIMLIVAGAGLLSNIVMGKVLHSHGGHSDDHRVLTHVMLHPEDGPRLTSLGRAESIRRATLRRQSRLAGERWRLAMMIMITMTMNTMTMNTMTMSITITNIMITNITIMIMNITTMITSIMIMTTQKAKKRTSTITATTTATVTSATIITVTVTKT